MVLSIPFSSITWPLYVCYIPCRASGNFPPLFSFRHDAKVFLAITTAERHLSVLASVHLCNTTAQARRLIRPANAPAQTTRERLLRQVPNS